MKICQSCSVRFDRPQWECPGCGWTPHVEGNIRILGAHADAAVPGFDAAFFQPIASIDSDHFWFSERNALIAWALDRFAPAAESLLDVGCGTGHVLAALQQTTPHVHLTGTDAFVDALRIAAHRSPSVELVHADALRLPYEAEFDVVCAFDVLEHIDDDRGAMQALVRATKPRGVVVATVPQHSFLWSPLDDYARHCRRYSRAQLSNLFATAGLQILKQTSFVSLLLPAMLVSRLLRRGRPIDPLAEFRVSPTVNAVGRAAMAIERALIRAGVTFPVGGSLLTIARRPAES